jgi:stearoyl-CoA desaturase (delta-9 desaturase)
MKTYIKGYHWPHMLFFFLTPLIALFGTAWSLSQGHGSWETWVLAVILLHAAGMSITAGYHRLFAHKSYKTRTPIRLLYMLFGASAFQGSVRWWACGHRYHHRYVDTNADPYSISKGFWYAHLGWLFRKEQDPPSFDWVKDLDADPYVRLQARFYLPISIIMGFGLPTAIASLWGDPWGGFFIAGVLRMVANHHLTFCINSVCHYFGKQTYSDRHTARDHWVAALLTHGEGYHNFHHEFQNDYRNAIRAYQWDPTKWLIQTLATFRLARDLKFIPKERILAARLAMDQKRAVRHFDSYSENVRLKAHEMLLSASAHLQEAHQKWIEMKKNYQALKKQKMDALHVSIDDRRAELKLARQEFRNALARWQILMRRPTLLVARA